VTYDYNNRNQRTAATNQDGEYWTYGYDSDGTATATGQVVSAVKKLGNSTAIPGTDLAYAYDDIGNLQTMTKNGNTWGPKLAADGTAGANLLNQYEDWSGPRQLEILGSANSSANITITPSSGSANVTRAGKYWYGNLSLSGNEAQWIALNITGIVGGNSSTELAHDYLKPEPTHLQYDADGNLIEDGKWHYWYDGENRLIRMETSDIAVAAGATHERIVYGYDSGNRRITKQVYHWQTVAGQSLMEHDPAVSILYLYDGWNLVAELDALNTNAVVRSYAWGLDMSGTGQGAGGVGGLVMADLNVPTGGGNTTTNRVFYGYDGNGNVITLAEANSGNVVASYDYDPFGNTIAITGNLAVYNPMRFSTKYLEADGLTSGRNSGLYYYGRRFLGTGLMRWLNRDPIGERGGLSIYGIGGNDLMNRIDLYGLEGTNMWGDSTPYAEDAIDSIGDWAGRALLSRWLNGGGNWVIYDDPQWSAYMMDNDQIKGTVRRKLVNLAMKMKTDCEFQTSNNQNFTKKIKLSLPVRLTPGEGATGYEFLGGSNSNVGDFAIAGTIDYDRKANFFNFDLAYTWNDIIDPEPTHLTDTIKSAIGHVMSLGQATDYRIWITWHASAQMKGALTEESFGRGTGWPFDSK